MSSYRKKKKFDKKCGFKKWNMVKYVERTVDKFGFHLYNYLKAEYQVLVMSRDASIAAPFIASLPGDFDGDDITADIADRRKKEKNPIILRFINHNAKFRKHVIAMISNPSSLHPSLVPFSNIGNYSDYLIPDIDDDENTSHDDYDDLRFNELYPCRLDMKREERE